MGRDEASELMTLLFESWYSSVVRYACRVTGNFELAEDVVQEAFMALYRELRRGTAIENPKAWTLCVVRRKISKQTRDSLRHGGVHESLDALESLTSGLPPALPRGIEMGEITRLFSVLSPREEEVLLLRLGALKYREIGEQLGISPNSVTTLLARALRKLQRAAARSSPDARTTKTAHHAASKTLQ
jgi:RNA polymerase sigma-70 factor (ECF subfamily)